MSERVTVRWNWHSAPRRTGNWVHPRAASTGSYVLIVILALGLTGCSWADKNGTRHVVILGFGVVSFTNQTGAAVQDVRGLGLVLDEAVSIGLVQRHRVEIDPQHASNLVVSISANPFSMTVKNFGVHELPIAFSEKTRTWTNQ